MDIANTVCIVTGGASGLGAGVARALAEQNAKVLVCDTQEDKGQALAKQIGGFFELCDVTQQADAERVIERATALGCVTGLVNCAGIAPAQRVLGRKGVHTLDGFAQTVNVNLVGSFNMIRLCAQAMAQNPAQATGERGVIVSTASVAAYDGQIGQAAYAASKAGIAGMTLPIARDLAEFGIRNMAIAPGIFATPMLFGMPQAVQDALAAQVPFPSRLGQPQDFAKLVLHIFANDMLNGEVIRLDGAIRMPPK